MRDWCNEHVPIVVSSDGTRRVENKESKFFDDSSVSPSDKKLLQQIHHGFAGRIH